MKPDPRLSPRKIVRTQGLLTLEGAAPLTIDTLDLAPGGMSIAIAQQLAVGQRCLVNFEVFLHGKMYNVAAVAKVLYSIFGHDGFKTGLQFTEVSDASGPIIAAFMKG